MQHFYVNGSGDMVQKNKLYGSDCLSCHLNCWLLPLHLLVKPPRFGKILYPLGMRTQLSGLLYIRMQGFHISQGSGQLIKFWKNVRCGETSLQEEIYPRLFSISTQKTVKVYDLVMQGDRSQWNFTFRRRLFQWEEEQLQEIKTNIRIKKIHKNMLIIQRWLTWCYVMIHETRV